MSAHINTPEIISAMIPGDLNTPNISMRAMFDRKTGTYTTVSISVEHPIFNITPTLIRRLRLGNIRTSVLRKELLNANPELAKTPAVKSFLSGKPGRAVSKKVRTEPQEEQLELAGTIVRLAKMTGDFPFKSVERTFGLEPDEAKLWVTEARKRGLA